MTGFCRALDVLFKKKIIYFQQYLNAYKFKEHHNNYLQFGRVNKYIILNSRISLDKNILV